MAVSTLAVIKTCRPGVEQRTIRDVRGYENPQDEIAKVRAARRLVALGAALTVVNALKSPFATESGVIQSTYEFIKDPSLSALKDFAENNKLVQGAKATKRMFDKRLRPAAEELAALKPAPQKFEPLNSKL